MLTYVLAMVPAFLLLVGFAVWARNREAPDADPVAERLRPARADRRRRGALAGRLRPAARAAAEPAPYGGPAAERVMREYQQQAIELGFLHDRYLRGTAPADFAERGTAMVAAAARPAPLRQFPHPERCRLPAACSAVR